MARQINNIEDHNKYVKLTELKTVITFRTQQLADLWINEMSGQISDGMWENSRHTEWLWSNVLLRLGNETKVEVYRSWDIGRRSFGMSGELWNIIGDRIMDENGFETEQEAKRAWKEIAVAIANATLGVEIQKIVEEARKEKAQNIKDQWPALLEEWREAGIEERDYSNFTTYYFYLDPENRRGLICPDKSLNKDEVLRTVLRVDDKKYYIAKGKLKEALETLRDFTRKMESYR